MSDYQYQEALNARAEQNRENEERRAKLVADAEKAQQAARESKACRRATRRLILRSLAAIALIVGLRFAAEAGLIASALSLPAMLLAGVWLAFWVGAYVQLMYCKGGLLEWTR